MSIWIRGLSSAIMREHYEKNYTNAKVLITFPLLGSTSNPAHNTQWLIAICTSFNHEYLYMPWSQLALPVTGNNKSGILIHTQHIQARCHAIQNLWFIQAKPGLSLCRCEEESISSWVGGWTKWAWSPSSLLKYMIWISAEPFMSYVTLASCFGSLSFILLICKMN